MPPLEFTRTQVIKHKSAITEFARTHIYKNELVGQEIDRSDVATMWWLNTKRVISSDKPERQKLLDQASDSSKSSESSS